MNSNKKTNFIIAIIWLVCLVGTLWIYPSLPDTIASHWNASGQIDKWANKSYIFTMLAAIAGINLLFVLVSKIDPKKENYERFKKVYNIFRLIFTLFMACMIALTAAAAKGDGKINTSSALFFLTGILFASIGNYLPKCKHNYSFGIKTPWTLASENVWNKTHRMAGPIWFICGVLMMAAAVVFPSGTANLMFIVFLPTVVLPMVYSFFEFKKENSDK